MDPEMSKKQKELWEQVSRRSSLSALSLASTVRPITKEEKEKENNKKSSPTKAASARARVPGQAYQIDNRFPDAVIALKLRKDAVRHHLERTTGPGWDLLDYIFSKRNCRIHTFQMSKREPCCLRLRGTS